MALNLEVLTPKGSKLHREDLDKVILRRQEEGFDIGSEVVVLPHHGDMMVRLSECDLRLFSHGVESKLHVTGGFAEVTDDTITVLTSSV